MFTWLVFTLVQQIIIPRYSALQYFHNCLLQFVYSCSRRFHRINTILLSFSSFDDYFRWRDFVVFCTSISEVTLTKRPSLKIFGNVNSAWIELIISQNKYCKSDESDVCMFVFGMKFSTEYVVLRTFYQQFKKNYD